MRQDPTALGNIVTGVVLMTLWPILFGAATPATMAAVMPWALAACPLVLLVSVQAFRAGNLVGAVANGVLSGVTLCQNGFWGLALVAYAAAGREVPADVSLAKGLVDGAGFLAAAFMLLCLSAAFFRLRHWSMGLFMGVVCLGFCLMGLSDLGLGNFRGAAGVCIVAFAAWMVYSGSAMLVEHMLGKKALPY